MRQQDWTVDEILEMARAYQGAAVLIAAAELDFFTRLARRQLSALELAREAGCDTRGTQVLLDALTALGLARVSNGTYTLAGGLEESLAADGACTVLGMARHQGSCLRKWAQLAQVVKTGHSAQGIPSVRGADGDLESFIEAMHNISEPVADSVISAICPPGFKHLLDVGGATGTWTAAFLRACPSGRATLLDLPDVIEMARRRLGNSGAGGRINYVAADYTKDPLPKGADLAWLSAIVHQNSPGQNRDLFRRVHDALEPGGRVAIRDIVMEEDRSKPPGGALFAVNMLVATEGGGTFTFAETREWLEAAGFVNVTLARHDPGMHSIIVGYKAKTTE
jgi:SAM-dependent methyltransferase